MAKYNQAIFGQLPNMRQTLKPMEFTKFPYEGKKPRWFAKELMGKEKLKWPQKMVELGQMREQRESSFLAHREMMQAR